MAEEQKQTHSKLNCEFLLNHPKLLENRSLQHRSGITTTETVKKKQKRIFKEERRLLSLVQMIRRVNYCGTDI